MVAYCRTRLDFQARSAMEREISREAAACSRDWPPKKR
jgi:hypothetical protein